MSVGPLDTLSGAKERKTNSARDNNNRNGVYTKSHTLHRATTPLPEGLYVQTRTAATSALTFLTFS
jgi:hypothetical protein